jgi:hypothetical protein
MRDNAGEFEIENINPFIFTLRINGGNLQARLNKVFGPL